jgi:hypothetical protein
MTEQERCPKCGAEAEYTSQIGATRYECLSVRHPTGNFSQSEDCYLAEATATLRARVAELEAENAKLREVVERLPKTADGVPITPGMELFYQQAPGHSITRAWASRFPGITYSQPAVGTTAETWCWHSTRAAAEAAQKGTQA